MKVQLSAYLPTSLLKSLQQHLDFALLEPTWTGEYIDFYKHYTGPKLLDNGFIENNRRSLDHEPLIEYARAVDATWVIAPDKLGDWGYNLSSALKLSRIWPKKKILVCLGGPTPFQFTMQSVVVRALGFHGCCLSYMLNRVPVGGPFVHMLGFKGAESYSEFYGPKIHWLSLDTVEPLSAAHWGWSYQEQGFATFPRPKPYSDLDRFDEVTMQRARQNIHFLRQKLNGPV